MKTQPPNLMGRFNDHQATIERLQAAVRESRETESATYWLGFAHGLALGFLLTTAVAYYVFWPH